MQNVTDKFSTKIKQEQIRALFGQSIFLFIAILFIMFVIMYFFWNRVDRHVLLSWFFLNLVLTIARGFFVTLFRHNKPEGESIFVWARIFAFTTFLSGVIWGSISFLFLDPNDITGVALIAVILTGMTSGSLMLLSSYVPAYLSFACAVLLQFTYVAVIQSVEVISLLGYLTFSFLLFNAGYSFMVNRNMADSLRLRFENLDLLKGLEKKNEEMEKANKDKSRFLSATSHDLRQPLHAMDLYLGALRSVLNTEEQRELLAKSQASSKALSQLLNALMDVSRLDAGTVTIEKQNVNLKSLLDEIYHSMQPHAESLHITLQIKNSDITVYSDPILLGRIIRNFITNAVKHSCGNYVRVEAEETKGAILLKISDDGKGIANTEIENIFSEFYQLSNPERDRTKGLGLGLAIVKRIAFQLEHKISVFSELNRGSTFSILLPVVNEAEILQIEKVTNETFDLSGIFAIIIEDETGVRDAMRLLLRSWDCEVLVGDSLAAINNALEQADYPMPDVIISDYRLRENKTGLDAIISLRKKLNKNIPAIVITGDTAKDIAKNIVKEHCELVYKPVNAEKLKEVIAGEVVS